MKTLGKIAMVTGAGKRLGRRLALAFADRGYNVVLHYNSSESGAKAVAKLIEEKGRECLLVRADLSKISEIDRAAKEIASEIDSLDVLVHNAAIFPTRKFEEVDAELWDATMNTNLRSIFFLTQALVPLLEKAAAPSIINLASLGGYEPWVNHIPYCVSKAGVVMLTKALAKKLAPAIRVNAIAPGIIVLPDEEVREHLPAQRIPLGRYGTAQDLISAVFFLAETAEYMTGNVLALDGGQLHAR